MTSSPANPFQVRGRVLLIGWDAADWKIISPMLDRGELPHLQGLIERGAMGDLLTLQPPLSPMLWNSIATGHRPDRHGVHGFTEVDELTNSVRAVGSTSRTCKALWNIVTQCGGRAHVVNWYASHPAEPIQGICVSDVFSREPSSATIQGAVHPAELSDELADLRVRPEEIDEQTLHLFVPRFGEVDQDKDNRLTMIAKLLAESFTVHNLATRVVADEPWNLAAVYYPGIDHFCHGFVDLHPPRRPHVSERDFALYSEVVRGAYRLHDLFLGRLLQLAGPDTSVVLVSDHGFHSDHLRPRSIPKDPVGPTVQHRDHGIQVIAGEGIARDERIYGAGLLDVAPTILSMLGLPIGNDVPGRVLSDAFVEPPRIDRIDSWEAVSGEAGMHPPGFVAPSRDQGMMLEHFAALGYVDAEEMQGDVGPAACRRENAWHLAQSLLYSGQTSRAVELLLQLCHDWPDRRWYALELVEALRKLGCTAEARDLVEAIVAHHVDTPAAQYLIGIAALEERHHEEAVAHLTAVGEEYAEVAGLHLGLGLAFLRLRQIAAAEVAFRRATEIDPHEPRAWVGLARCAVRRKSWPLAERHALHALGIDFGRPLAHTVLGLARMRQGLSEDAATSFRVALRQSPNWTLPQRFLDQCTFGNAVTSPSVATSATRTRKRVGRLSEEQSESLRRLVARYHAIAPERPGSMPMPPAEAFERHRMTVVSGLPRSGTSLMMQMLAAGGGAILSDGTRSADADNPAGYLEWEPIKQLARRPEVLRQAADKVVKVVSPQIPYLPIWHRYDVIFLDRDVEEVLQSQIKMRERRGTAAPRDRDQMREILIAHRDATLKCLRRARNVRLLVVPYPELVTEPADWSERIAEFLNERVELDAARMAAVVRPELYRNRFQPEQHHVG